MISIDYDSCIRCGQCVRYCSMGYLHMKDGRPEPKERRRCIQCGHCAAVCPRQALTLTYDDGIPSYTPAPANPIESEIVRRRSVRHFKETPPPAEIIQRALDIAEYAPSGKNFHLHQWTVLYGRTETDRVTEMALDFCARTGEAPELLKIKAAGTNLLTCDAPVVIIVWSPDNALNPVVDPAIAMTLVEMQLNHQGLATCWGGYLRQVSDKDEELRSYLGIPEGCHMRCALMTGYADKETYPNQPPRPAASVNWLKSK